jgi:membrane fusion protein (multidrug efflux system)
MEFPNPEKLLLPGMYVQVEMPTGTMDGVFLVPQEGVGRDRRGRPTAMVVNAENVVEERQLTVLEDRGSDWIVSEGLAAGDRVIVAGLQKTGPGATVAPEDLVETAQAAEGAAAPADGAQLAAGDSTAD